MIRATFISRLPIHGTAQGAELQEADITLTSTPLSPAVDIEFTLNCTVKNHEAGDVYQWYKNDVKIGNQTTGNTLKRTHDRECVIGHLGDHKYEFPLWSHIGGCLL